MIEPSFKYPGSLSQSISTLKPNQLSQAMRATRTSTGIAKYLTFHGFWQRLCGVGAARSWFLSWGLSQMTVRWILGREAVYAGIVFLRRAGSSGFWVQGRLFAGTWIAADLVGVVGINLIQALRTKRTLKTVYGQYSG